ncbi:hypothetical protein BCR34DRAFT_629398 [Clohesyomyces aquaticus]|uniref:Uncharacterized protein n=1 Tax=Clohesyomyces aquaticus TaxID=1231657 RepID=A0A1Y1Y5E6_9PLEO|nr:hypothetical protein BCR34DRAFT_629398 [Clohesyomyces aquaticus]
MMETRVWVILGAVLGFLLLTFTAVLVLFSWKRSKRRIRGFSLRAVTPLDDAEFESWRRPSQYTKRPEKYIITPTERVIIRSPRTPIMFEKELALYDPHQTTPSQSPTKDPSSPIRLPEQARRKSSVSIADRPPTPYSPSPTSGEFPKRSSRGSHSSRRSQGSHHRHNHYPSMSEASDFNFDFGYEDA